MESSWNHLGITWEPIWILSYRQWCNYGGGGHRGHRGHVPPQPTSDPRGAPGVPPGCPPGAPIQNFEKIGPPFEAAEYKMYKYWHTIRTLITSCLDYANSLLKGSSGKEISCLQRLQNRAAKLIFMAKKIDHVSPLLKQLHWLPVHKHIDFKTIFKCYSDCAPSYVKELITLYQPNYSGLRSSSDSRMLTKPKTNLKSSSKDFCSAAPDLWNGLP